MNSELVRTCSDLNMCSRQPHVAHVQSRQRWHVISQHDITAPNLQSVAEYGLAA